MAMLQAGATEADITPPVGCAMAGFAMRRSESVHDPLRAKALVLDDGVTPVALLSCDVLTLGYDIVERARGLIEERTGLAPRQTMITCTHTHSGPVTSPSRLYDKEDMSYVENLIRTMAGAVSVAWNGRRPARLGFATEPVQVGINRRELTSDRGMILGKNPDGPVDPHVEVLRIDGADGAPIAVLFAHAAHPVVLGWQNRALTADYPGYAATVLERVLGERVVALFGQGCCGNINADRVGGTFEEARRLGTILGAAALKAAASTSLGTEATLRAASRVAEIPLDVPRVDEAEAVLQQRTAEREAAEREGEARQLRRAEIGEAWARDYLEAARRGPPQTQPYEIQVLAIGRTVIVGLPGEVFVEVGLGIKKRSPAERTIVLTYANHDIGFAGYVPTAKAFEEGGYEPQGYRNSYRALPLDPSCAELIEEEAVRLIDETLE